MANRFLEKKRIFPQKIIKVIILVITGLFTFFALILPDFFNQSAFPMAIGDVVTQDILAPFSLTFQSEVLTQRTQLEAENAVEPIYLPIDPSIGRRQVENLRTDLYYITIVRQDDFASLEQKIDDIQAIDDLSLPEDIISRILQINDARWDLIETEATDVLEQIMRNTVRSYEVPQAKRDISSRIDFSFPQDQANIVVELIEPFIVPNSVFSEDQTSEAKSEAVQSVEPVTRSFIAGETLVSRGQIISETDYEALSQYGLIQPSDRTRDIIGAAVLVTLVSALIGLYFRYQKEHDAYSIKSLLLISLTFLLFLGIARFFVIGRTIIPYVYPIAAFGLTLSVIYNLEIAVILSVILSIFTAYGGSNNIDLTIFYIIPAIIGILTLGKAKRIASFFLSGVAIGFAGIGIILGYRLPDTLTDWIGIATLSGASLFSGIGAASVTLLLQFVYSQVLGTTTALQLLDTSRPDHPLLQQMLRNAPGSYQHSLQVANLAEQAAETIGADSLLVRVGAIFHDCGKSQNPQFFIENQVQEQLDPHDDIDPVLSAQTIITHVTDGVELAKKYRLPKRIIDFIREHHGTMHTHYQYSQAIKETNDPEKIDKSLFTYPGPKPQSRETALLMLADGTEARARSEVPKNEDELLSLIDTVFNFYEQNHQLEDTSLTLNELKQVKLSFYRTLKGTYHPRVKYPALEQKKSKSKITASQKST
jgi:putative nucleotidyltransferase with HDIG domain